MRRLILAAPFLVFPFLSGSAEAACPATLTDCPSVNANRGNFGGEVQVGDSSGTQAAGTVLNVPTFAAMQAFQPDALNKTQTIQTAGFAVAGDGGGAIYDWDSTNTCNVNPTNVVCVKPSGSVHSTTGRWRLRMTTGGVDVRSNGAKCDGVTDDSTAINNLITNVSQYGGGVVVIPATNAIGVSGCVISGADLSIRSGVTLKGSVSPWSGIQGFTNGYSNSTLLLAPNHKVAVLAGGILSDMIVWRQGLAAVPTTVSDVFNAIAQWQSDASTAVTVTSSTAVERVRIIGFTTAIKQVGGGDNWLRDIQFDSINGVDRGGGNAVTYLYNVQANAWWTPGFGGRTGVVSATPTAGNGYTTGDSVQPSGGTCTIRPTFTISASAGVPTALTVTNVGDCTLSPSGTTFTGGTGAGLQATINYLPGGYRPGIGIYEHDGVGLAIRDGLLEELQTGVKIQNSVASMAAMTIEGVGSYALWKQTVGVDTEACTFSMFTDNIITANWTNWLINAATDQSGATCNLGGGNNNTLGMTQITGGFSGSANGGYSTTLHLGPKAMASVRNLRMSGGQGGVGQSNVVLDANSVFTASGLMFSPTAIHNPWITADPTATYSTCQGATDNTATLASIGYWDTCQQTVTPLVKTGTSYTVLSTDSALILNPSGTFTLTLPNAATFPGKMLSLKTIAAFAINSATANVAPIDSATLGTAILASTAGKWTQLQSNGTNWVVMSAN